MEVKDTHTGGSLHISSDVIEKIARLATLEVEGVDDVTIGGTTAQNLIGKLMPQKPITVELKDDVADIEIAIRVKYGVKVPELSEKIQSNVKSSVQNMTSISVAKVNVVVIGIAPEMPAQ